MDQDAFTLVTGGTGFVGQALVKRLINAGHRVRVVTRSARGFLQEELRKGVSDRNRLELFEGDIGRLERIGPAFKNVRYVFHVAALVNSIAPYEVFERANVKGTENICELSLRYAVKKLVYVSTCDVFGIPASGEVITETTPYRAWSEPYPDTKIKAAELVKTYQKKGLRSTIIYPGWVYGPGDRAFLPSLACQLKSGIMALWCRGGFEIYFIYIEDLVDALILAVENPDADNDDFLILDEKSGMPLEEFCRRIGAFLGLKYRMVKLPYRLMYAIGLASQGLCRTGLVKSPMLSTTDVKCFGHTFKFSTAKARNKLKWIQKTSSDEGIEKALEWYDANMRDKKVVKN